VEQAQTVKVFHVVTFTSSVGDAHVERLCACIMCVCVFVCVCVCVCVVLPRVGNAHVERLVFLRAPAAVDSVPQGTLFQKYSL
jgi:hypothetical protein